jgi:hypothetical protein
MQPNIVKSSMTSGLIIGCVFSLNFLISLPKNNFLGFISILITLGIIYLMYKLAIRFRDTECEGAISYGKTLTYVILSFFFAALISGVVKFVYIIFINKEYLNSMLQESYKIIEMLKIPMDEEKYDQLAKMMKPTSYIIQTIWANVFFGTLLGLILGFFVKKDKSIFD